MSLDVIIRRNISFVGCILIIAATELNKISRSLFIALHGEVDVFRQFRLIHTLCIFVGLLEFLDYCIVLSLFLNHVSSFHISPLLL